MPRVTASRRRKDENDDIELDNHETKKVKTGDSKTPRRQTTAKRKREHAKAGVSITDEDDEDDNASEAYKDNGSDNESGDSDDLVDSDGIDDFVPKASSRKRKRTSSASPKKVRENSSAQKRRSPSKRKKNSDGYGDDDDDDDDVDESQKVVGRVVEAPKTGHVPPGQISNNTLNFLRRLQKPECNDRIWFKLHEPVYRLAEKEWKAFIDEFTMLLTEADPQIPVLPPNDVVHRIYRDIRFSNDKTPYKTGFSASFSRSGRKGLFAHYHISVKPNGSVFAAGAWQPGKNELQTIRNHILRPRGSRRLRTLISAPAFVTAFGKPERNEKSGPGMYRQNIFGMEDELKVAPKGVDKHHPDIDLLKCRSFAVVHRLTDSEVLSPDFKHTLARLAEVVRPFVHLLNDMMTVEPISASEGEDEGEEGED